MTPYQAYEKAKKSGKRIPELEPYISKDIYSSYLYAKHVIKGKFILAEPAISKDAYWSCNYAEDVIKGRWEIAEPTIIKNAEVSYYYAKNVIKGKLPDFMHNQMILNNNNTYTKKYIEYIK